MYIARQTTRCEDRNYQRHFRTPQGHKVAHLFLMFLFTSRFLTAEIIDIFVGFYTMKMSFMNICAILLAIVEKCKLNECTIVFHDLIKILWPTCKRGYFKFGLSQRGSVNEHCIQFAIIYIESIFEGISACVWN